MDSVRVGSLKEIYERYSEELHRYLTGALRGRAGEADDIAQMTFLKLAAQNKADDIDNPRAYLFRAAKNMVIDQGRSQRRNLRLVRDIEADDHYDQITPEQIALSRQELRAVEQVIINLPAKQRRVFILSRIHNMSYEEIVKETGLSKAGVKQHIVRALAACRSVRGKGKPEET